MRKTTVYLPDDLKEALERVAAETGRSEAALIRESIRRLLDTRQPPSPRLPRFASGQPRFADRTEELLSGLGRR